MGERYEIIQLKRNGRGYLIGQQIYVKDKLSRDGETLYVKCLNFKTCPCRAIIDLATKIVRSNGQNHTHDAPDLAALRFRAKLKQASASIGFARLPIPKVYEHMRGDTLDSEATERNSRDELLFRLPSLSTVASGMRRKRSELLPPNPAAVADVDLDEFFEQLQLADGGNFLLADSGAEDPDRVLLFSCNRSLEILKTARVLYADGTF